MLARGRPCAFSQPRENNRVSAFGFTLVEVLVVLVIIGVATAMIRLGGGTLERFAKESGDAEESALTVERLAKSVGIALERAQVGGRPLALNLATGQYRFSALDAAGRWVTIENDPIFAERSLPSGWRWVSVTRDGDPVNAPFRLDFGSEPVGFSIKVATQTARYSIDGSPTGAVTWAAQ